MERCIRANFVEFTMVFGKVIVILDVLFFLIVDKFSLLHDVHKVVNVDFFPSVFILTITYLEHQLDLMIRNVLLKFDCYLLQVIETDGLVVIIIVHLEGLLQLVDRITLHDKSCHQCFELIKIDLATAILVSLLHQVFDTFLVLNETKRTHGILQLFCVDEARLILIEKPESFINLGDLLGCELNLPLLDSFHNPLRLSSLFTVPDNLVCIA